MSNFLEAVTSCPRPKGYVDRDIGCQHQTLLRPCWLHLKTSRSFRLSPEMPTMAPPRLEISSAAQPANLAQQEAPGCHQVLGDLVVA